MATRDTTDLIIFSRADLSLYLTETPHGHLRVLAEQIAHGLGYDDVHEYLETIPKHSHETGPVAALGGQHEHPHVSERWAFQSIGRRIASDVSGADTANRVSRFTAWIFGEVLPTLRAGVPGGSGGRGKGPAFSVVATTAAVGMDPATDKMDEGADFEDATFVARITCPEVAGTLPLYLLELLGRIGAESPDAHLIASFDELPDRDDDELPAANAGSAS